MSGRELAERLRRRARASRVLFMSGYTDDAMLRHGVLDPGQALLLKPFGPTTFLRRVRSAFDGSPLAGAADPSANGTLH